MAARQATQSNTMLYAMITFIGLFIVATTCAVIFYVKSGEYQNKMVLAEQDLSKFVSVSERNNMEKIVGKPESGKSYLAIMNNIVNGLYAMVLGQEPAENIPATVKFNEISMKIDQSRKLLGNDYNPAFGPNGIALLKTIEELKQKLENSRKQVTNLQDNNDALQSNLQDAGNQLQAAKDKYLADLSQTQSLVNDIRNQFDSLKKTMDSSLNEQVQQFQDKLDEAQKQLNKKQLELQNTTTTLTETNTLLHNAMDKLDAIKPKPDREVQAYAPDAQIVRVDLQNGIIYLDAGIKDHVYRGLTFAIYDRNKPIPADGQGKAEAEVFQVSDQVCAARLIKSDKSNPVVVGDIVTNLIWDRKGSTHFVVLGNFDYNEDGKIDPDGNQRIVELIERWGGTVTDDINVDTDFVVLGFQPRVLPRPTQEELDVDPLAQQRYENSVKAAKTYDEKLKKANNLDIPVFNQKRFLYLIGYDTLMHKNPML